MPPTIMQIPNTPNGSPLYFSNVQSFNQNLVRFANRVSLAPEIVVKKVALQLFTRIIRKTPVDTGRARSSWNIGFGQPDLSVPAEGRYPGAIGAGIGRARTRLESYGQGDNAGLPIVWITSNLPYIVPLENGHSQQSPAGMVANSVAEEQAAFKKVFQEAMR